MSSGQILNGGGIMTIQEIINEIFESQEMKDYLCENTELLHKHVHHQGTLNKALRRIIRDCNDM